MNVIPIQTLSEMIRELRRREFAAREQEIAIAQFLASHLGKPVDWPQPCVPTYTSREIVKDLIAPLNGHVFNGPQLDALCQEQRPCDWPRFDAQSGLKCCLRQQEIRRVPGGYQNVHKSPNL